MHRNIYTMHMYAVRVARAVPAHAQADTTMSSTLKVTFKRDDPLDSDVVDGATGRALFTTATRWKLGKSTTTISDAQQRVVAEYENNWTAGYEKVTYRGEAKRASEWLPRVDSRSSSRRLTAPDGRTFLWEEESKAFKLVDAQSKVTVAKSRNAGRDGLLRKRQMGIDVNAELVPFLDVIVLSFIMLEAAARGSSGNKDNGDGGDWGHSVIQGGNGSVAAIVALGAVAGAAIDRDGDVEGGGHGEHADVGDHGAPTVDDDHRHEQHEENTEHGGHGAGGDDEADGASGADGGEE
ncbi:hypothetical protein C8Q80DRAFT_1147933 [Daedaleopsis nitida]|nr:hypothetical protein C8Q80DRAFT_1147933 [Daedaleopsis nitida]